MSFTLKKLLMPSWLILSCWAIALGQNLPAGNDATERFKLVLEDNASTFDKNQEKNLYTNTLSLTQPEGSYKFTAGLLSNGDNHIVFHRVDDELNDSPIARINLQAVITQEEYATINSATLYTENPPSSAQSISLNAPWTATGCYLQTNGSTYITQSGSITYTVPAGYENATIGVYIYAGSNFRGGYFAINGTVINVTSTGWKGRVITGVNSDDVITIRGAQQSSTGSYAYYDSPDILAIDIDYVPPLLPTISVTPSVSYMTDGAWSAQAPVGNAAIYHPNDVIDLGDCTVTDAFEVSTSLNNHSTHYNYHAQVEANVQWPESGSSTDFYASVDFSKGDGSDLATCEYTGVNNWKNNGFLSYYTPSSLPCAYIRSYAELAYVMPASFMGTTVNVTVTSDSGQDGAGNLVVNGVSHTFVAGESYTWTVDVAAGGYIMFTALEGDSYTCDISKIVISSGNGSASNAPASKPTVATMSVHKDKRDANINKRDIAAGKMKIMD